MQLMVCSKPNDNNSPPNDASSCTNENEIIDNITKTNEKPLPKNLGKSSKPSSPSNSKFWKSNNDNKNSNSNPYACEYHDYSPRKPEDHIPPPVPSKKSKIVKQKSKCGCNCCKKKPSKTQIQKEHNKQIIGDVPQDTVTVVQGEDKVTKIVNVNGMKFNVAVTGGKKGSKVLHKIKIMMLRRKRNPQKRPSNDINLNKNEIQAKKQNKCGCFGGSKNKSLKPKTIKNNETSFNSKCKLESNNVVVATLKVDGVESNPTIMPTSCTIKNE